MLTLSKTKGELARANSVVNDKSNQLTDEYSVRNQPIKKKDPICRSVQDFTKTVGAPFVVMPGSPALMPTHKSVKMLGSGTPSTLPTKAVIEPITSEIIETTRTRTSQGQPKSNEPKVFKIQKIIGKTPEPSKLPGSGLSTEKLINIGTKGSFNGQTLIHGATKGLSAKDVYQVGAYQLNKTSKTPCAIIARPPSSQLVPTKNLSHINLQDVNLS